MKNSEQKLRFCFAPLKSLIYSSTPEQDRALPKPEYLPIKQYTHTISLAEPRYPCPAERTLKALE